VIYSFALLHCNLIYLSLVIIIDRYCACSWIHNAGVFGEQIDIGLTERCYEWGRWETNKSGMSVHGYLVIVQHHA